ncbi:MAG: hypothetical protein IIB00_04715 [candidate division Zixibacteria bacterium]|nr:hypothetical protein [candidate division Zixibacteria bacterium]
MRILLVSLASLSFLIAIGSVEARINPPQVEIEQGTPQLSQSVLPSQVRQVTHNKGNLVTTVDNWGLIGGYSFISAEDYPSGEWPRGSAHSYLAEMKYWMGVVNSVGDTLLANTNDDFQPIPSLRLSANSYDIFNSTDSLSYDYVASDTIGSGVGSPALGWRVWNNDSSTFVYNQIYSTIDSSFHPGGPVAVQESHYRFDDGARGFAALGLEMTQTIYQWNFCYNENFMFVILDIKNVSGEDYSNFAFGLYCDFDVGGNYAPTGENGRLGDVVDYDTAAGLAWTYELDGYDEGWSSTTGIMGTKILQMPGNVGMTSFKTGIWDLLPLDPDEDAERYALISTNQFDTPLPPDDQYYIQCSNGISLPNGQTVRLVFAIVAGKDETEFRANADLAQTLYDNFYVGPLPPPTPNLTVRNGDGIIYLSWDNQAETFVDPLSGVQDFLGYKIYRSVDLGQTWGERDYSVASSCQTVEYFPLAIYRQSITGEPMAHSFIDDSVTNGVEYWYCLAAFDTGDTSVPIESLQNAFGLPDADANVVRAMPESSPAGYYSAQSTVLHTVTGDSSAGTIWPTILDKIAAGSDLHKVGFYEDDITTWWALTNNVTGDTLLRDQTLQFDYMEAISDSLAAFFDIVNGMQVAVFDGSFVPDSTVQIGFASAGVTTLIVRNFLVTPDAFGAPRGSAKQFRPDYEIRVTATGSSAFDSFDGVTPVSAPFEVWNITTNQRLHIEIFDWSVNGAYDAADGDYVLIVNFPYDGAPHPEVWPYNHSWMIQFEPAEAASLQPGDVFRIAGAPLNGPDDEFYFSPDGINASLAAQELEDVKVVPNPYFGRASWENRNTPTKINFTNLPGECELRIFTLAGDFVKSISHNSGGGDESWDLLSESGQLIASGMYFFHVSSTAGEFVGRFSIVN